MKRLSRIKQICVSLSALILISLFAAAQPGTQPARAENPLQRYVRTQTGRDYSFLFGHSIVNDGKPESFLADNRPIFYFCGMEYCVPCDLQTPYFIKLAQKYQQQARFVYLTYNSYEQTRKHLTQLGFPDFNKQIGVLSLPESYIVENRLCFGYPTKFITDPNGKVYFVEVSADKDKEKMFLNWSTTLEQAIAEAK